MSELAEAALQYASQGLYVFPVFPNQKKPSLIEDYYNLSSCSPLQIQAWWSKWPEANIGLDCGKSGLVAIDVDSEFGHGKGHNGFAVLTAFQALTGGKTAWNTRITETPSGGLHFLFESPRDNDQVFVKTNSDTFGARGIDTRSKGGYVVLPPSKVPHGIYKWKVRDAPFLPVPRKLLSTPQPFRDSEGKTELERKLEAGELVGKGRRDNFLIEIGGKLRHLGFEYEEIRGLIEQSYKLRCDDADDPMTGADFDRLATSAMRWKNDKFLPQQLADKNQAKRIRWSSEISLVGPPIRWWVPDLLPKASLVAMYGMGGAGKSTFASWAVAQVTSKGGKCLVFTSEETFALFVSRCSHTPNFNRDLVGEPTYSVVNTWFPEDADSLRADIIEHQISFVYFDAIKTHQDRAAGLLITDKQRSTLAPLLAIALETGCTILVNFHENKGGDYSGSTEMRDVPRLLLHVTRDTPETNTTTRIRVDKTNLNSELATFDFESFETNCVEPKTGEVQLKEDAEGNLVPMQIRCLKDFKRLVKKSKIQQSLEREQKKIEHKASKESLLRLQIKRLTEYDPTLRQKDIAQTLGRSLRDVNAIMKDLR